MVTGDSFAAQHAPVKHFGLGLHDLIDYIEVQWPNDDSSRFDNPAINRYRRLTPLALQSPGAARTGTGGAAQTVFTSANSTTD